MPEPEKAQKPEDLTRLFVERANDGDAAGIAALYEENAVMAYPPGERTVGRDHLGLRCLDLLGRALGHLERLLEVLGFHAPRSVHAAALVDQRDISAGPLQQVASSESSFVDF